jgi:hypothetical protein
MKEMITNEATARALQAFGVINLVVPTGEGLSWPIDLPNTEANTALI